MIHHRFVHGRCIDRFCRRLGWSLWPSRCLVCAEPGLPERDLCRACLAAWPYSGPACPQCALPLPLPVPVPLPVPLPVTAPAPVAAGRGGALAARGAPDPQPPTGAARDAVLAAPPLCGACLRRRSPLQAVHAACAYRAPVDRLLPRFKFHRDLAAGRLLGAMMGDAFAPLLDHPAWRDPAPAAADTPARSAPAHPAPGASATTVAAQRGPDRTGPDPAAAAHSASAHPASQRAVPVLIPIPLHPRRLRQRGYDQALELARALARRLDLPLQARALVRARDTAAQSRLDARQRRRNLRDAFAWCGDATVPIHVVLIDDVMTTGATLHSAARTLRRAGVLRVDAWVCARVLGE